MCTPSLSFSFSYRDFFFFSFSCTFAIFNHFLILSNSCFFFSLFLSFFFRVLFLIGQVLCNFNFSNYNLFFMLTFCLYAFLYNFFPGASKQFQGFQSQLFLSLSFLISFYPTFSIPLFLNIPTFPSLCFYLYLLYQKI